MDYYWFLILAPILAIILFFIFRRKDKLIVVNSELIDKIISIIPLSEIVEVSSEVSRVKFKVKNLDAINLDDLKNISQGVFVSGNNIKVMFKDSADKIVSAINSRR